MHNYLIIKQLYTEYVILTAGNIILDTSNGLEIKRLPSGVIFEGDDITIVCSVPMLYNKYNTDIKWNYPNHTQAHQSE